MLTLWQGLIIGFSIAAPVGPVGLLVIRRSMAEGRLAGFISGLGAATADAVYGLAAALGLAAISSQLIQHERWLRLGGGAFLVYLGISTLRARGPKATIATGRATSLLAAYVSTFLLTLANPLTILAFVGILAGVGGFSADGNRWSGVWLVTGVFLGSAFWWLLLSAVAGWLGGKIEAGALRWLNFGCGLVIGGFGVWQLATLI